MAKNVVIFFISCVLSFCVIQIINLIDQKPEPVSSTRASLADYLDTRVRVLHRDFHCVGTLFRESVSGTTTIGVQCDDGRIYIMLANVRIEPVN